MREQGRGGGGGSAEEAAEAVRHRVGRMAEANIDIQVSDESLSRLGSKFFCKSSKSVHIVLCISQAGPDSAVKHQTCEKNL